MFTQAQTFEPCCSGEHGLLWKTHMLLIQMPFSSSKHRYVSVNFHREMDIDKPRSYLFRPISCIIHSPVSRESWDLRFMETGQSTMHRLECTYRDYGWSAY